MPRGSSQAVSEESLPSSKKTDMVAYWCLRILVALEGHRCLVQPYGYGDSDIADFFGLHGKDGPYDPERAVRRLQRLYRTARSSRPSTLPSPLETNLHRLQAMLGLNETEIRILGFAVLLHTSAVLNETSKTLGQQLNSDDACRTVAKILELELTDVRRALAGPKASLPQAGLIYMHREPGLLERKIRVLRGLAERICSESANPEEFLSGHFEEASAATLDLTDFDYLAADVTLLRTYLETALRERRAGVNLLLYGAPGTGKTQLTKALAADLGARLYAITTEDEDGDRIAAVHRFDAYTLCQRVVARSPHSLVLFDEVEDVFPADGWSPDRVTKGGVNQILETNPVPAFWVANSIRGMDRAFLRRFDVILELAGPSRKVRERLLARHLEQLPVSPDWIVRTAAHEGLTPAEIERAARVVAALDPQPTAETEARLDRLLGHTREALGQPRTAPGTAAAVTAYRLDCLNPSHDLAAVLDGLKLRPSGRLCLYGPPGTGKTAFAHQVAAVLDKPLLVKRASDLLSPYVGESERLIAHMFREAEARDALLLIDEADSFLRERTTLHQSWEVTQVNEFLVQLEHFTGLLMVSTNLVETLDAASLRRFDLKVHFDYLRPEQAVSLCRQVLAEQGIDPETVPERLYAGVSALPNLTPGDFATVIRQARFQGALGPETLLENLRQECALKPGAPRRGIGFTAT